MRSIALLIFAIVQLSGCAGETTTLVATIDLGAIDGTPPPSGPCGSQGSIDQRIADCATPRCAAPQAGGPSGLGCPGAKEFAWDLVARTDNKNEVWLDQATGLLWSDDSLVGGSQPTLDAYCRDVAVGLDVKGNLPRTYRLPTMDDYAMAESHGLRQILRSIEAVLFWTATPYGENEAWYYADGELRHMARDNADEYFRAHCVAPEA